MLVFRKRLTSGAKVERFFVTAKKIAIFLFLYAKKYEKTGIILPRPNLFCIFAVTF